MKRIALCVLALLVACNDDDKKDNDNSPKVLSGQFVDSAVQHLHYQTATQSGETDADGTFKYLAGETITFSIGGIVIGTVTATGTITPFTMFNVTPPTSLADIEALFENQYLGSVTDTYRAINLTVFLQSIDADGNPENGIDLTGRNEAYANASLSFSSSVASFIYDVLPSFVQIYGGGSTNPSIASALTHLYNTLQLSTTFDVVSSEVRDSGNDGDIDRTYNSTYDANGRLATYTRLNGVDEPRNTESYTYDANGNLATDVYSSEPDGAGGYHSVETTTFTYVNGVNTKSVEVDTSEGTVVRTQTRTFTPDAAGRITQRVYDDVQGTEHYIETTAITFDAATRTITETTSIDNDGNGSTDSKSIRVRTVDTHGNETFTSADDDGDGNVESSTTISSTYDAAGRFSESVREDKDETGTVMYRYTQRYTYDSNGRVLTSLAFSGVDGTGVDEGKYDDSFAYDTAGRLTLHTESRTSGGVVTSYREERTYTATGRAATDTTTYRDAANNVTEIDTITNTYEAGSDRLLSVRYDYDNGGTGVEVTTDITTYTYVRITNGLNALLGLLGLQAS